jgi:PAS domain S-box-containing protein
MAELNTFFNIAHDLFCIVDRDGYYKLVNPALLRLLSYPEAELMQHPFIYFMHPEDVAETQREYGEVTQGKRNRVVNNRFRSSDGRYHWLSWSTIVQDDKGVFYAVAQNITEQKRLEEALLKQQRESKRRLNKAVILTQERERTQISRELHDNANQVLCTVKLFMEACRNEPEKSKELLEKAMELQQGVINEIRDLSKRLSAPTLGNMMLCDSVWELIQLYKEISTFRISLDVKGIAKLEVEQEVHLAVYRILQEQLTNIAKHAAATEVNITLDFKEGKLTMVIYDDGKGFNIAAKSSGIGLHNMKTRAESVGGAISIQSAPGAGTELVLTIPLLNEECNN